MPDPAPNISLELARRDLSDIQALRNSDPFNRYWGRRLKKRYEDIDQKFREDGPDKCDATTREAYRRILLEFETLLKMLDVDEQDCRRVISQVPPSG